MGDGDSISAGSIVADRYRVVSALARGSSGDVYLARDLLDDTDVAIKVLRAEFIADDGMRRRFRREAAVLKALTCPSIVRLLDVEFGRGGRVFLVTEFVEGPTVADRIATSPLDVAEATVLVSAMADALGAAHEHGVLHGDLKPANILWSETGPRLIDFSASKILGLDRLTATGEVSGTPAYMAPEVLTGKGDIDARIDVYGLGVALFEALSGQHPFRDSHIGRLLMKIDAGDRMPLDALVAVPARIAEVVHRAMSRMPTDRYDSVDDMKTAWDRAVDP
ncbi:MAG: serine/threonine-protein kinase [Myxococcota bacterium]